jgi:hypothetical protein
LEDPPGGSEIDEYVDLNNRGEIVGFHNDDQGTRRPVSCARRGAGSSTSSYRVLWSPAH